MTARRRVFSLVGLVGAAALTALALAQALPEPLPPRPPLVMPVFATAQHNSAQSVGLIRIGIVTIHDPACPRANPQGLDMPIERHACKDVIIKAYRLEWRL